MSTLLLSTPLEPDRQNQYAPVPQPISSTTDSSPPIDQDVVARAPSTTECTSAITSAATSKVSLAESSKKSKRDQSDSVQSVSTTGQNPIDSAPPDSITNSHSYDGATTTQNSSKPVCPLHGIVHDHVSTQPQHSTNPPKSRGCLAGFGWLPKFKKTPVPPTCRQSLNWYGDTTYNQTTSTARARPLSDFDMFDWKSAVHSIDKDNLSQTSSRGAETLQNDTGIGASTASPASNLRDVAQEGGNLNTQAMHSHKDQSAGPSSQPASSSSKRDSFDSTRSKLDVPAVPGVPIYAPIPLSPDSRRELSVLTGKAYFETSMPSGTPPRRASCGDEPASVAEDVAYASAGANERERQGYVQVKDGRLNIVFELPDAMVPTGTGENRRHSKRDSWNLVVAKMSPLPEEA